MRAQSGLSQIHLFGELTAPFSSWRATYLCLHQEKKTRFVDLGYRQSIDASCSRAESVSSSMDLGCQSQYTTATAKTNILQTQHASKLRTRNPLPQHRRRIPYLQLPLPSRSWTRRRHPKHNIIHPIPTRHNTSSLSLRIGGIKSHTAGHELRSGGLDIQPACPEAFTLTARFHDIDIAIAQDFSD